MWSTVPLACGRFCEAAMVRDPRVSALSHVLRQRWLLSESMGKHAKQAGLYMQAKLYSQCSHVFSVVQTSCFVSFTLGSNHAHQVWHCGICCWCC